MKKFPLWLKWGLGLGMVDALVIIADVITRSLSPLFNAVFYLASFFLHLPVSYIIWVGGPTLSQSPMWLFPIVAVLTYFVIGAIIGLIIQKFKKS
jgi:hypothetical protein